MTQYHKIQTIYKRDMTNGKRLLEGEWSLPEFRYLAPLQWIGDEKVDGTNIRVLWDGERVEVRGKTDNAQLAPDLISRIAFLLPPEKFKILQYPPLCLYGEGYGAGRVDRESVEDVAVRLGVDVTPQVFKGALLEAVECVREGMQSLIGNCTSEGLILRPEVGLRTRWGDRIIAKIKTCDFTTKPKENE
jgi:hypothetical protein